MTTQKELTQTLARMKAYTNRDDLSIYKTPGGWYHVIDSTFNYILNAPTKAETIRLINAYVEGYLQGKA